MRVFDRGKGASLIELLIVSALVIFVGTTLYTVLVTGSPMVQAGFAYIDVSTSTRLGIERMAKELHGARIVAVSIPTGEYIMFQVPGNSNTIQYSLGGDDGMRLIRREAGQDFIVCNNIHSLQFSPTPFSGRVIHITLEAEKSLGAPHQRTLTAAINVNIKPRN